MLESIDFFYGKDLYSILNSSRYELRKHMPKWTCSTAELRENMDRFAEGFIEEAIGMNGKRGMALRFADFLHELLGGKPFGSNYRKDLIYRYGLIDEESYEKRYPVLLEKALKDYVEGTGTPYRVEFQELSDIVEEMRRKESQNVIDAIEELQKAKKMEMNELDALFGDLDDGGEDAHEKDRWAQLGSNEGGRLLLLMAEIVVRSREEDSLATFSKGMIEERLVETFLSTVEEELMPKHDRKLWTDIKVEIGKGGKISLDKCARILKMEEGESFRGYDFTIYSGDTAGQKILQSIHLLIAGGLELGRRYSFIQDFFIEGNPVRAIDAISKLYRERYRGSELIDGMDGFLGILERCGIAKEHILIWQAYYLYDEGGEGEQLAFVETMVKEYNQGVRGILLYLYEKIRFSYYRLLRKGHPHLDFISQAIFDRVREFTLVNIDSIPTRVYREIDKMDTIYNGPLKEYGGDIFEDERVREFKSGNLEDDYPRIQANDRVLMIYRKQEELGIYGSLYLKYIYMEERDSLDGSERLVILDDLGSHLEAEEIYSGIEAYLRGRTEFGEAEGYLDYMQGEYLVEGGRGYTIAKAFWDMDRETRKRFLNFYLRTPGNIVYILFTRIEDRTLLSEIIRVMAELNLPMEPLLAVFIESGDGEAIRLLEGSINIVDTIKSYPYEERLEALRVLGEDRFLRNYLRKFEKDKSRVIRELIQKVLG